MTLYRFDKDTADPPKSNCDGECAKTWPAVPPQATSAAGAGIDDALLGEVTRADGVKQLTIGGWPMYRYAKDTKAGDAKGQGVGGPGSPRPPTARRPPVRRYRRGGGYGGAPRRAAEPGGLSTRKDPKLGEIVVDKNGITVYRFMKDSRLADEVGLHR